MDRPQHRNYLRVRGEYIAVGSRLRRVGELPPRARRILFYLHGFMHNGGTTSACAENTARPTNPGWRCGNYLRVRGEYILPGYPLGLQGELPPRARRIPDEGGFTLDSGGTTSACAENTWSKNLLMRLIRNYLRVRGEYHQNPTLVDEIAELPPRARRIPGSYCPCYRTRRTTSACAENTPGGAEGLVRGWNYLRVRGEYSTVCQMALGSGELPPRARRILVPADTNVLAGGTTSACAENTPSRPG